MFLLREALPDDLEQLRGLARTLNTLNLPDDSGRLQKLLEVSRQSFDQVYRQPRFRDYLFVLEDVEKRRLIGSCLIIAQHGTHERPAVYFDMREEQKFSSTLDKYFIHPVLQLRFDYDGPTEIGGLILDKSYRAHPLKLGRVLSFVRFLFIGMHRNLFRSRIVAELLPPLNDDGTSDLWDCLGKNFTDLDYREADLLSRDNVEFIRSLFPSTPIYTALLPAEVREIIGVVGAKTQPARRMLQKIGFRWDKSIDPFDGGPTYAVDTDQCAPVVKTRRVTYLGPLEPDEVPEGRALVSRETLSLKKTPAENLLSQESRPSQEISTEDKIAPESSVPHNIVSQKSASQKTSSLSVQHNPSPAASHDTASQGPRFVATLCDYRLVADAPELGVKLRLAEYGEDLRKLPGFSTLSPGDELGFLPY